MYYWKVEVEEEQVVEESKTEEGPIELDDSISVLERKEAPALLSNDWKTNVEILKVELILETGAKILYLEAKSNQKDVDFAAYTELVEKLWKLHLNIASRKKKYECLLEKENCPPIEVSSFKILLETQSHKMWLNDTVIAEYFKLLDKRDQELCNLCVETSKVHRKRSWYLDPLFISHLFQKEKSEHAFEAKRYNFDRVRKWVSKRFSNVFDLHRIYIPVNFQNVHWALIVVDMEKQCIIHLDSSYGGNCAEHDVLYYGVKRFLHDCVNLSTSDVVQPQSTVERNRRQVSMGDKDCLGQFATWTMLPLQCKQQKNGYDCGVFVCMLAECVSCCPGEILLNEPSQETITKNCIRKTMYNSLMMNNLQYKSKILEN